MRRARWVAVTVGILAVSVLLMLAGLRGFLASGYATGEISTRLETYLGGPVHVGKIDVGLDQTRLDGVHLFEPNSAAGDAPWVTVETVQTDVSLWDVLGGTARPRVITLTGADLTLRFDPDGRLLTRLPTPKEKTAAPPEIRITRGRLTLRQTGRADMVLHGVEATLSPAEGNALAMSGTLADDTWGAWQVDGRIGLKDRSLRLHLVNDHIHATPELLAALPFVPPYVWQQVRCDGDTSVDLRLQQAGPGRPTDYRVELHTGKVQLRVASIDLDTEQTSGRVVIENGVVLLDGVKGQTAQGEIATDARLDFRAEPDRLQFAIRMTSVNLSKLPESWKLPKAVRGKLTGRADLVVTIAGDKVNTEGDGQGVINEARVVGLPARPIRLRLRAAGDHFEFHPDQTTGRLDDALAPLLVALLADAPPPEPSPLPTPVELPLKLVEGLTSLLTTGVDRFLAVGTELGRWIPPDPKPVIVQAAQKPQEPAPSQNTYLEANLGLDDIDVADLIRRTGVTPPFPIAGRGSLRVKLAFPINAPGDAKAYRAEGTAGFTFLELDGIKLTEVRVRLRYADGDLRLEELAGKLPVEGGEAGTFEGNAAVQVLPMGVLSARLQLTRLPIAPLLAAVPQAKGLADGVVTGLAEVKVDANNLREPTAWQGSARLQADQVRALGLRLTGAQAAFALDQGVLRLTDARGDLEGTKLAGTAQLTLAATLPYKARLSVAEADLSAIQKLTPSLRPPVKVEGRLAADATVEGTVEPFKFAGSGTVSAPEVKVDRFAVEQVQARWQADAEALRLTEMRARLYDGAVTGSGRVPLDGRGAGQLQVKTAGIDTAALSRSLPDLPFRLEGKADADLRVDFPAAAGAKQPVAATLDLQSKELRLQSIPAERIVGKIEYQDGKATYRLNGDTLGGRFTLDGRYPAEKPPEPPPSNPPLTDGRLRLERLQLGRLWEVLRLKRELGAVAGEVTVDVPFTLMADGSTRGDGSLVMTGIRWGDAAVASNLRATIQLTDSQARLREFSAVAARGLLRGQVAVNLRDFDRSWFSVTLDNAEASQLLAPWPDLAKLVQGSVQARMRGSLGREIRGNGVVELLRAKVAGVAVDELRLPVDFTGVMTLRRGTLDVRDSSGRVAGGRVSGGASLRWGEINRLEGQMRFQEMDLRTLLRPYVTTSVLGAGKASGRVLFNSDNLRSINDLNATVDASFRQTQALELPVLSSVVPFLPLVSSPALTFDKGDLRGRLTRGTFRVDRLAMESSFVYLFADGTVGLNGRLDLHVIGNTRVLLVDPTVLRLLGIATIPAAGPIPVAVVLRAASYLSNRTVRLQVTGTVRSPYVRIDTLSLITDEAVRFFLGQVIPGG